jgi:hypothetical protein
MIITVKSMRKLIKKMVSVGDAGTTGESRKEILRMGSHMGSADRVTKMGLFSKGNGGKVGDMELAKKNQPLTVL